jgi:hypothetical protein
VTGRLWAATDTLIIQAYQRASYFRIEYGLVVGIVMMLVTTPCAPSFRRVTRKG